MCGGGWSGWWSLMRGHIGAIGSLSVVVKDTVNEDSTAV